ncbi:MAG TPA: nucleotidyl transferase AbiEii/AbiGii toxin family protein [Oligoflexia bacterium]|nr:nucleotidyl transferase AbiEii/AbiGii toxin family protein [Oligoflexia bacterium]HMP47393.1 nucleotidyl transferase AbiEii/AbiGii toxin family protein [Oligoflexia bacterium]
MIIPSKEDSIHRAWLFRILSEIAESPYLLKILRFKGGTCAAMQGILPRFSVDLDFDLLDYEEINKCKIELEKIFASLDLSIKDQSEFVPQYFLKYPGSSKGRSIVKIDCTTSPPQANKYEPYLFTDLNKIIICQTRPTMFANKLVAILDRHKKHGGIAGRDLFDIQTFSLLGLNYETKVIEERWKTTTFQFMSELRDFISANISQQFIDEDLNPLLPNQEFKKIRKHIKREVLMWISDEIERLK